MRDQISGSQKPKTIFGTFFGHIYKEPITAIADTNVDIGLRRYTYQVKTSKPIYADKIINAAMKFKYLLNIQSTRVKLKLPDLQFQRTKGTRDFVTSQVQNKSGWQVATLLLKGQEQRNRNHQQIQLDPNRSDWFTAKFFVESYAFCLSLNYHRNRVDQAFLVKSTVC